MIVTRGNGDVNLTWKRSKPTSELDLFIKYAGTPHLRVSKMRANGKLSFVHCVRYVVLRFGREGDQ